MVSTAQLAARLAKLESKRGGADRLMCVLVHGGFIDPWDDHDAEAGHLRFDKADGEPFDDFVGRCKAGAREAGERLLVVMADAERLRQELRHE